MSNIAEIYTEAVYDNLKPLYANWEPGSPVQLGDYGMVRDRTFIQVGNIEADLQIKFSPRKSPVKDNKVFSSKGSADIKFIGKGTVPINGVVNAKAMLQIDFSSEKAAFFNAADCEYTMIADKAILGKEIMKRFNSGDWDREWAIITDIVKAGATTVAVSGGSSSSIAFQASGDVPNINLADASIGLTVASSKNIGYQIVAQQGLIPLIGLCKIQSSFLWWGDNFKPLSLAMRDPRIRETLEDSKRVRTEESPEHLQFAQLK